MLELHLSSGILLRRVPMSDFKALRKIIYVEKWIVPAGAAVVVDTAEVLCTGFTVEGEGLHDESSLSHITQILLEYFILSPNLLYPPADSV